MNLRRLLVLVLVSVLLALTPLAQASPPDQTWFAGFYDDGDYDDVVLLVTAGVSAVQSEPLPALVPVAVVIGFVPTKSQEAPPEPPRLSDHSRAPPLS